VKGLKRFMARHSTKGFHIPESKELLREKWISSDLLSRFVGFSSHSYFFQAFRKETGMSPAEYKERYSRT